MGALWRRVLLLRGGEASHLMQELFSPETQGFSYTRCGRHYTEEEKGVLPLG